VLDARQGVLGAGKKGRGMKFSVRKGIVFWRLGERDEEVFCFLPNRKKLGKAVIIVTWIATVWLLGAGPIGRIAELFDVLCHSGAKLPVEIAQIRSCPTMSGDLEMLRYLWLAAIFAVPIALVGWWSHMDRSGQKISN
jgi:hypothetical protein